MANDSRCVGIIHVSLAVELYCGRDKYRKNVRNYNLNRFAQSANDNFKSFKSRFTSRGLRNPISRPF